MNTKPTNIWCEQNGIIYLPPITSNGMTGPMWFEYLEEENVRIREYAEIILYSDDFKPTKKGTIHNIIIFKDIFFEDNSRTIENIWAEEHRHALTKPNPEVACLILNKFSVEEIK